MTDFLNSTRAPEIQHRPHQIGLPFLAGFPANQISEDPIMPLWRTWRDAARHEVEAAVAGRGRLVDDRYHVAWGASVRAFEILGSFPGSSPVALAARLHAAFHHAYASATPIEKRDPVYRAQVTALTSLLPALPEELAAEIERSLDGEE